MQITSRFASRRPWLAAAVLLVAACDGQPAGPAAAAAPLPVTAVQALDCTVDVRAGSVSCAAERPSGGFSAAIIGGQNDYVTLSASNTVRNGDTVQFDVTVQNLLPEAMGTPDGVTVDTAGVSVFFLSGPTVTQGTGTVTLANPDGVAEFTAPGQAYFRYPQLLAQNQISDPRTWKMVPGPDVQRYAFKVYVAAEVQPLLVINEVLVNPGGTIADTNGEWFEVYNSGRLPVQMMGMVIADSAASGRRPYHLIAADLTVASGGYVVLGNNSNTTLNGGVPVDYSYGGVLALTNSLDALKIARPYGSDTLTIDRTQYASAAVSAQNGVSRELTNPALDNSNLDGSNWADALVIAVYGAGGRGTPKAQNSTYTP